MRPGTQAGLSKFVRRLALLVLCSFALAACDGALSTGLPDDAVAEESSCTACHAYPPGPPHPVDDRCSACHSATVDESGATVAGGAHVNGQTDFEVPACDACHGNPPAAPHPAADGCNGCHPATVTAEGQVDWAGGKHANGKVEVEIAGSCSGCHGYPPAEPHPQSNDCSACHGATVGADGQLVEGSETHKNGTVDVAIGAGSCGLCHGNPPADPHPEESNCNLCHRTTVDEAGDVGSDHMNGTTDIKVAASSCVKCHGMPPAEDHPSATNCAQCHGCVVDENLQIIPKNEKYHADGQVTYTCP